MIEPLKGRRASICLIAASVAVMAASCTTVEYPARRPEFAATATRIAVMPFTGQGGGAFSMELAAILSSVSTRELADFKLVDRQQLEPVLLEARRSSKTIWDPRTRTKLRLLGADALLTGKVIGSSLTRSSTSKLVRECVKSDGPFKCEQHRDRRVTCTTIAATFRASVQLTGVQAGIVHYARTLVGTARGEICPGSGTTEDAVASSARDSALVEFRKDVAPYTLRKLALF